MTVVVNDVFGGYSAPATSGSAPFTATDNTVQRMYLDYFGSPTAGDKVEFTMTFPTGTVTFRARWSTTSTLLIERVSTIPGTSNGTATLQTFGSGNTNQPRTDGDTVRLSITVNRGAANASTTITFGWHGRSRFPTGSDSTTNSFTVDGELTPTAAAFAITGSSFRNRPNLEGRSPDTVGGGTYSYTQVLGSYVQSGSATIERYDINGVVADGSLEPVRSSEGPPVDVLYGLAGGISEMSATARAGVICAAGKQGVLNLATRVDIANKSCLIAGFFAPDFVVIGSYTNGSYDGDYDSASFSPVDDGVEHLFEFVVDDSTQQAQYLVDGVAVLTVDISAGAGSLLGPGTVGIGMWRDSRGAAGITVTEFEIETGTAPVVSPCASVVSAHEFYDPPRDLDGVATDTFPFMGQFVKHPASAAAIRQSGSVGSVLGAGRAVYLDQNILGQIGGVETPLPADYCAWLSAYYPERDAATLTTRTLIWEDDFNDLLSGEALNGRSHDGGTAGVGVWTRIIDGREDVDGPDAVGDGDGRVMQPDGETGLNFNLTAYHLVGPTFPARIDVEVDVWNRDQTFGKVGVITHYDATRKMGLVWDVFQHQSVGPYRNSYHAGAGSQPTGALTTTSVIGSPGTTKEFETRVDGFGDVKVYFGGDPDVADGVEEIEFYDGQFSTSQGLDVTGDIGLKWEEDGGGLENPLRITAVRVYAYTSTFTPAFEFATQETLVRYDAATDSGFGARLTFDHTSGDQYWPTQTLRLFERNNGVETRLVPDMDVTDTFTGGHSHNWVVGLRVTGTVLVLYFVGGGTMATFDYASDVADDGGSLVSAHDTGDPGLGGSDASEVGDFLALAYFEVDAGSDVPIEPLCDGPGEPPGTGWPPGDNPTYKGYWIKQNNKYRFVRLPTPDDATTQVYPKANTKRRPAQDAMVKANNKYRVLAADLSEDTTYYPPGPEPNFDPCLQLPPPIIPPDVDIGPPPDRLFLSWNIGGAQLGPLWTACFRAMGPSILSEIRAAASHGGAIYGTPGDKNKFMRGGVYAPDLMNDWIFSLGPIMDEVLAAQADGSFAGMHAADDWENPSLWPPHGLPLYEINRYVGLLKTLYPGLRVFIRARSGQLYDELPNLDGLISQMRMTGKEWDDAGHNAATYATIELNYCQARSWRLHLSQNFFHGPGSVSAIMSPEVVLDNAQKWLEVTASHPWGHAVDGQGGWEYSPPITGAAYLPVLALWRNGLQALGAPS
jgi:hypothetical protein